MCVCMRVCVQAALDKFHKGNDVELLRCIAHAEFTHSLALNKEKANVRDPATIVAKQVPLPPPHQKQVLP
jgi:hypothetical protein